MTRNPDRGAAAVEMALVMPVLLLLLCGLIDFGRAYNARITLSHSAREAVRVWALGGTADQTKAAAKDSAVGLHGVTADVPATACTFGAATTITVTADFSYITPFIAQLAPTLTTLSTKGVMRCGG